MDLPNDRTADKPCLELSLEYNGWHGDVYMPVIHGGLDPDSDQFTMLREYVEYLDEEVMPVHNNGTPIWQAICDKAADQLSGMDHRPRYAVYPVTEDRDLTVHFTLLTGD